MVMKINLTFNEEQAAHILAGLPEGSNLDAQTIKECLKLLFPALPPDGKAGRPKGARNRQKSKAKAEFLV